MNSCQLGRRLGVVAGGAAIIAMGTFTAGCSTSQKEAPSTTTTTTTTTTTEVPPPPPPSPSEKGLSPTGGNLFTPGVVAPPAAPVSPGEHPGINGVP